MTFPPNIYNPYILQDLHEKYNKYYSLYPDFKTTFPSFLTFIDLHKKYKPISLKYQHAIRREKRKYHYLYE